VVRERGRNCPRYCTSREKLRKLAVFTATRAPSRRAHITARRRMKLAGPCRVNSDWDRERREAMAPDNRRLSDFVLSLVRLRNRTKFRFASLRAVVPGGSLLSVWHCLNHRAYLMCSTSVVQVKRTLLSTFTNCKHFFQHLHRVMHHVRHDASLAQPHFESPQLRHVMHPSILITALVEHFAHNCASDGKLP